MFYASPIRWQLIGSLLLFYSNYAYTSENEDMYRYTDNGKGVIIDNKTGLIGLKDRTCIDKLEWDEAKSAVAGLAHGVCGLLDNSKPGDWRLPEKRELAILVKWHEDEIFPLKNDGVYEYWSITQKPDAPDWIYSLLITQVTRVKPTPLYSKEIERNIPPALREQLKNADAAVANFNNLIKPKANINMLSKEIGLGYSWPVKSSSNIYK